MKKFLVLFSSSAIILLAASCSQEKGRYIDLRSGKAIKVEKDSTGGWVDADTKNPVYIYVDTKTHDTIYGKTGEVINGHVVRGSDSTYTYDMDAKNNENYQVRAGDYKKKADGGDIKIKTDDKKIKIDGKTGERKRKSD